jgi:hypothetical protein
LRKLWKKTNAKNEQQAPERALTTFPDFRESKAPLWEKMKLNKFLLPILLCMSILQKTFVYIHDTTSNKVGNYLMKLGLNLMRPASLMINYLQKMMVLVNVDKNLPNFTKECL